MRGDYWSGEGGWSSSGLVSRAQRITQQYAADPGPSFLCERATWVPGALRHFVPQCARDTRPLLRGDARRRIVLSGAHQLARQRAGVDAALEDRLARDHRQLIAVDLLHETAAVCRHVVDQLRLLHLQTIEVD